MDKKLEGALQIILAIAIIALVLYFSGDIAALRQYGYLGAFVISALSSATIFFPAPGWAVVAAMGAYMDPVLLGLAAGAGSAIGELTGYAAGEGARDIRNSKIKESKDIHAFVQRYGVFAVFFLAFIPNPLFDVAGLVSGALRIPWWQFLIACACGRVLRYVMLAMLGNFTLGLVG
jgi:membrane protein YqaA with SNARE-associated domain